MNQTENAIRERGGVPFRDYTQVGSSPALSRRFRRNGVRESLGKMNFDKLGRFLIWPSLALGLMEVLMPQRVQKLVGAHGEHTGLIRLLGFREIIHALLIFTRARPHQGVWSRVAGDAMDLGLLGAAFASPCSNRDRVTAATASIVGITAMDVLTATQLNRQRAEEKRYSDVTQEDLSGRLRGGAFRVKRSITINRSPEELYRFWRNFENLPQFMYHLEQVRVIDDRRSHWVAKAPLGARVAWEGEITEDRPNELIAWQSTGKAAVPNSGVVRFVPAPAGRGTEVHVEIEYRPPGGAVGKTIVTLFGEEPGQQIKGDLARFKQVIETGEVMRSDSVLQGTGQKMQRPAKPPRGNKMAEKYGQPARSEMERTREQSTM